MPRAVAIYFCALILLSSLYHWLPCLSGPCSTYGLHPAAPPPPGTYSALMVVLVCLQTLCVVLYLRPDSRKMIVKQFPRHPVNLQVSDMEKRGSGEGEKNRRRREKKEADYPTLCTVRYVWCGMCCVGMNSVVRRREQPSLSPNKKRIRKGS